MEKVKVTKKEYFGMIREIVADNADLVAFVDREVELLSNRKKGETKTQKENAVLVENIFNALVEAGNAVTIKDINAMKDFTDLSPQKISAMLKKLVDTERVTKVADGKIMTFKAN